MANKCLGLGSPRSRLVTRIQVQVAYVGAGSREYLVEDGETGNRRKETHTMCLVRVKMTGVQSLWGT